MQTKTAWFSPAEHTLFHNEIGMQHNGNLHVASAIASVGPYASLLNDLCIAIVCDDLQDGRTVNESIHRLVQVCLVGISQLPFHKGLVLIQLSQCAQL